MARPRKHVSNAARQQAYRNRKPNVTHPSRGVQRQPVDASALSATAQHGRVAPGAAPRFLQRADTHSDVSYVQSLAMADDTLREHVLAELHRVARALLPLQRKAHPTENYDQWWERSLERAFEVLNGVKPPKDK